MQNFSSQWEVRGELQHARLDIPNASNVNKTCLMCPLLYPSGHMISSIQCRESKGKVNGAPFSPGHVCHIQFPTMGMLLQTLSICPRKQRVVKTFLEFDKNQSQAFSRKLCYHNLTSWLQEPQTCSERYLNNEASLKNAFAALHISLRSQDCEL